MSILEVLEVCRRIFEAKALQWGDSWPSRTGLDLPTWLNEVVAVNTLANLKKDRIDKKLRCSECDDGLLDSILDCMVYLAKMYSLVEEERRKKPIEL